jgi:hypothetical protein
MGYAGLKLDDIVERCELVTAANIRRTVGARRDTSSLELAQIAAACGVPYSWFERGEWSTSERVDKEPLAFGQGSVEDRVRVLEHYVSVLLTQVASLSAAVPPQAPSRGARGSRARQ